MSSPRPPNGNANGLTPATANGQLETPALTPISEHGDYGTAGTAPFPIYEDDEEETGDKDVSRVNGINGNGQDRPQERRTMERQRGNSGHDPASRKSSAPTSPRTMSGETPKIFKLSPKQISELTSSPGSIPMRAATPSDDDIPPLPNGLNAHNQPNMAKPQPNGEDLLEPKTNGLGILPPESALGSTFGIRSIHATPGAFVNPRPGKPTRSASSPVVSRKSSSSRGSKPAPLKIESTTPREPSSSSFKPPPTPDLSHPSPMPPIIPIPPLSLPTYLQLELSSDRPSPLYIHRSASSDFPYESSKVKFERLLNFLRLPPQLEQVLIFGALACLDSWLFTFTILPLRFLKAIGILLRWSARNALKETRDLSAFVYDGVGRVWQRRRAGSIAESRRPSGADQPGSRRPSEGNGALENPSKPILKLDTSSMPTKDPSRRRTGFRHRRTRSTPSALMPNHKADLLQGRRILTGVLRLSQLSITTLVLTRTYRRFDPNQQHNANVVRRKSHVPLHSWTSCYQALRHLQRVGSL